MVESWLFMNRIVGNVLPSHRQHWVVTVLQFDVTANFAVRARGKLTVDFSAEADSCTASFASTSEDDGGS